MKFGRAILLMALFPLAVFAEPELDKWDLGVAQIKRLGADEFADLPAELVEFMKERDCQVPQPDERMPDSKPVNVISGSFGAAGQKDWAVLCSSNFTSSIHVLWGGSFKCAEPFAAQPDKSFLQGSGAGVRFSREIAQLSPSALKAIYDWFVARPEYSFEPTKYPKIEHDAIEDIFTDKGSHRNYCHEGEWVQLVEGYH